VDVVVGGVGVGFFGVVVGLGFGVMVGFLLGGIKIVRGLVFFGLSWLNDVGVG
jgi:hypothetical protein